MNVTAEIELDIDSEIREIAEEVMSENLEDFVTRDSLDGEYMTWSDYHEANNDAMAEYLEAVEVVVADDIRELENQVAIARRAINLLLEERENRWYRKLRRLCDSLIRRVHWHMPRR